MDIATAALIRKRAELAGEALALDARLAQLRADLVHLDAAIRIMCPEAEPELIRPRKPSRKGCDWFGRQELVRLAHPKKNGRPKAPLVIVGTHGTPKCSAGRDSMAASGVEPQPAPGRPGLAGQSLVRGSGGRACSSRFSSSSSA